MRRLLAAGVVALLALSSGAGTVTTRDGKSLEGDVTVASPTTLAIKNASGSATVELSNVKHAAFVGANADAGRGAWQHQDVGKVHLAGSAAEVKTDASTFRLNASGRGFWGPKDSGHILYWPTTGDAQLIAHVTLPGPDAPAAIAGVSFRDSIDAACPMAAAMFYPGGEARFVRRPVEGWGGGPEGKTSKDEWIRLTRNGADLAAYKSHDGVFWQPIRHQKVPLAEKGLACLAVSSSTNAAIATASFDHVQLIPGPSAAAFFPGGVGPMSGVVMADGTMLAGRVETIDNGKVDVMPRFTPEGAAIHLDEEKPDWRGLDKAWLHLPIESVARVRMNPEPGDVDHLINGASGVLMINGDFLEADIQKLNYHQYLDITSTLLGGKRIDVVNECLSVVLREAKPQAGGYEVRLRDGSIIEANAVALSPDVVAIDAPSVGKLKFPASELVSIDVR